MNVVKKTLGRLALYFLLLAINIIPCASIIPDAFPTRNVSTIYLLIIPPVLSGTIHTECPAPAPCRS